MANDIEIVVGAKNQATKILQDVEQSTKQLGRSMTKMADKTKESANVMQVSFKSLAGAAAVIGSLKAAAAGIAAAFNGMQSSVEAFNAQEEAARGMTQAQLDFASALQVTTNVGDEATLALMQQAKLMGVQEDQLTEVATAATGLSEALGIGTTEALKKVNQAINGNANALQESLPALRDAKTEQEKLAIISEAAAGGLAKLREDAGSTAGIMERAQGAFGDLAEKIGALFEPIYRVVFQGFAVFAETLQTALMPAIDTVNGGFDAMQPVIDAVMKGFQAAAVVVGVAIEAVVNVVGSLVTSFVGGASEVAGSGGMMAAAVREAAEIVIGALTMWEVAWGNLGNIVQYAADYVLLQVEGLRADLEHVFVRVIPTHILWFATNFTNILSDMGNAAVTVVKNMAKKLADGFRVMWEFIKSGFEGGVSGLMNDMGDAMAGSLLEGFEAKTRSLPEIAARTMTATEKALTKDMNRIGGDLADEFATKFNDRIKGLDAALGGGAGDFSIDLKGGDALAGAIQSVGQLKATESRLLTRGTGEDPSKQIVENTKQTVAAVKNVGADVAKNIRDVMQGMNGDGLQVEVIA